MLRFAAFAQHSDRSTEPLGEVEAETLNQAMEAAKALAGPVPADSVVGVVPAGRELPSSRVRSKVLAAGWRARRNRNERKG
jgi:hypothetical protein